MLKMTSAIHVEQPMPPSTPLVYTIAGCSEHSGLYEASNILVDRPSDQASRWSGAHQMPNAKQWILLQLETLGILKTITFGKFHKIHPCNMKEFKIYVGTDEDNMVKVLHSGLKNDSIPEMFAVKHVNRAGVCFPTRYVKIVPLSAYGQNYHTSIWHVAMTGITDHSYVEKMRIKFDDYRESAVLLHILKHLRQRRLLTSYKSILSSTSIRLEHPLITQLYATLVLQGNWFGAESLLHKLSEAGLFDAYLHACQPHAVWKRLHGVDADGDAPSKRGGHAMCIDQGKQVIYLFGGWDGQKSLDDFWQYDIQEERWTLLSHSTSSEKNGPEPRSCHKMVFDAKTGCIYLLGRLGDQDGLRAGGGEDTEESDTLRGGETATDGNTTTPFCSEFHRYHTRGLDAGKWDLLSFDTASSGGPPLIFDHQMVMDSDAQMLYVFGGRIVDGDWVSFKYAELYSYNVRTSKWKMLQPNDITNSQSHVTIPSRFGHSMALDCPSHTLFIFAGQRDDRYLSDMYSYDINTNTATELCINFTANGGPDACFTQRAVLDKNLKEIYVFCGLTRTQQLGALTVLRSDSPNWVYRYGARPGKWTQILPDIPRAPVDGSNEEEEDIITVEEPQPRYAHQVVYDEGSKTIFMHGGNAGLGISNDGGMEKTGVRDDGETTAEEDRDRPSDEREEHDPKERRLDDFWSMTLNRPAPAEIIRRGTYLIRQQQFREMCEDVPAVKALNFLQNDVSTTVDHSNPEESSTFRSLMSHLLIPSKPPTPAISYRPSNPESAEADSDLEDSDEPPKKRSRQSTPEEAWTDKLDQDEAIVERVSSAHSLQSNRRIVSMNEDPEERSAHDEATSLSAERFQQRTQVFESLMKFIGENAKQPSGNLFNMMNRVEDDL